MKKALTGLPESVFLPVMASPDPLGYRSSTKLCLDEDNFGRRRIGLYQQQSKRVVDIPDCPVHDSTINKLVARLFPQSGQTLLPAPFYQHERRGFQEGRLKFVTIRTSPEQQSFGVIISHTGVNEDKLRQWATGHASRSISIYASCLSKEDDTRILSEELAHLAGPKRVPFSIGGQIFELSPMAFFQANRSLSGEFIRAITSDLAGAILLDLYGGFGAYSYALSENFDKIYLVDGNTEAISSAGSQPQTPQNLYPVHDSVEGFLARHRGLREDRNLVSQIIINPPRAGISAKVSTTLATTSNFKNASGLTYVSCNPQTLARDLKVLLKPRTWRVETVQPFDMFPQTEHVEVVAKLKRT